MKKFTIIALCFIMIATLMAGCRSKDPSETNSPTTAPTTATQAPTTAPKPTTPAPTTGTSPSTGATEGSNDSGNNSAGPNGTENRSRNAILQPRAY